MLIVQISCFHVFRFATFFDIKYFIYDKQGGEKVVFRFALFLLTKIALLSIVFLISLTGKCEKV